MVVYVLRKVPASLKGELSCWMQEVGSGVFVGNISAMVREKLWEKICSKLVQGYSIMIYSTNNHQGYYMKSSGISDRQIIEWEGLQLMKIMNTKVEI